MNWSELLFMHWPVSVDSMRRLLPPDITLDTYQGQAWIGVVPFLMSKVAPRICPAVTGLSQFLELNVRTYVTHEGKPGVWFFSLDAANRIAVRAARAAFNLPYLDAAMSLSHDPNGAVQYRSSRFHRAAPPADFAASYQPNGSSFFAQPNTLEYWLTARYCLYCIDRRGHLRRGEIDHAPWRLSTADCAVERNTMCDSLELKLTSRPHLLFASPIEVRAWLATRCN